MWSSSAEFAVKKRLARLIDEVPRYTSIVVYQGEKAYICLTKQSLYIVKQRFDGEPEKISYPWIQLCIKDPEDRRLFKLKLEERESKIFISPVRDALVDEIQMYWKTDLMLRNNEVVPFPLKTAVIKHPKRVITGQSDPLLDPLPGTKLAQHEDYTVFIPSGFFEAGNAAATATTDAAMPIRQVGSTLGGGPRVQLTNSRLSAGWVAGAGWLGVMSAQALRGKQKKWTMDDGTTFEMWVMPPAPVNMLDQREKTTLRLNAEHRARKLGEASREDYAVLFTHDYRKKMNLTADPASWSLWEVLLRTNSHDIGIIVARRKHLPPFGDTFQDLWFLWTGPKNEHCSIDMTPLVVRLAPRTPREIGTIRWSLLSACTKVGRLA
ncbi:hypothetical protein PAPYR_10067 [Paratrimastix pyriformis]|uniref:Uncharacterized protein n=1 Tax=Paratrimastix pyriformis TaxID=342808 RepID=A0ABQ8U6R8_9EUKA|nr:hypothetical protein PAPYR_10067 [Paratrimastix pyriformis]